MRVLHTRRRARLHHARHLHKPLALLMHVVACAGTAHPVAAATITTRSHTPPTEVCRPASARIPSAADALGRAIGVLGIGDVGSRVRAARTTDVTSMDYQSDRPYPPYLWGAREQRVLVATATGHVRVDLSVGGPGVAIINDGARQAVVSPRGGQLVPLRTPNLIDERAMDAWTVLHDFARASDVRVVGLCRYRDFDRLVLARGTGAEQERLFLDLNTGYPIKLDRREPHALWGDVHAEYLWSIWTPVTGTRTLAPQYTFRMVDGEVNVSRHAPQSTLWPADSATLFEIPASIALRADRPPAVPDTIRVDAHTFLLRTPAYTNVVTLQRDTVFVLDAPTDAARARGDSVWIGRLFPGRHPVVVVVTDLAWPHVGGVRYWVAHGATIASRAMHRPFIERVVNRQWTLEPDVLAARRQRGPVSLRFRPIATSADMAGGAVRALPIDGVGSEGALMVYVRDAGFLWAGDFIQPGGPDSFSRVYAEEVVAAVARAGVAPERYAAMHSPLTEWAKVPRLMPRAADAARPNSVP
ncbi:MAG: hypothetical protein MUF00_02080 [Gemmatimonadaceae bacterium]|nr:hypothetical protein [Gemmatimonadaceae bacterium]